MRTMVVTGPIVLFQPIAGGSVTIGIEIPHPERFPGGAHAEPWAARIVVPLHVAKYLRFGDMFRVTFESVLAEVER
jgi:hypothetical protein